VGLGVEDEGGSASTDIVVSASDKHLVGVRASPVPRVGHGTAAILDDSLIADRGRVSPAPAPRLDSAEGEAARQPPGHADTAGRSWQQQCRYAVSDCRD
jgi:hypothetical protein